MKTRKRIKTKLLTIGGAILASLSLFVASTSALGAGTSIYLSQAATAVDVTVTDRVTFALLDADTNTATVSDIRVTNNSTSTPVVISNIQATAEPGYTLEPFDTAFNTFDAGSKRFGIAYTGSNADGEDISGDGLAVEVEIANGGYEDFAFAGQSSAYAEAISAEDNVHMANIVLTVGMKQPSAPLATMQNFQCSSLEYGETTTLVDTREGGINSYIVGKAADDNCWMLQNLKLGSSVEIGDSITVDVVNNLTGDVTGTFDLSGKVASGEKFTDANSNKIWGTNDNPQFACEEDYGCYYNWTAATAGSGLSNTQYGDNAATNSICPAGWSLPSLSQMKTLMGQYDRSFAVSNSGNAIDVINAADTYNTTGQILGLTFGGYYGETGRVHAGTQGVFATRTSRGGHFYESLSVYSDTYRGQWTSSQKYLGDVVRCISLSPSS